MKWRRLGPTSIIDHTGTWRIFKSERPDGWTIYHCHYAPNERIRDAFSIWGRDGEEAAEEAKAACERVQQGHD